MAVKTPNYSAELTATILAAFAAGDTVQAIAEKTGKSVRSITAKLSREGVYKAKAKAKAENRVKKADLVARIAVLTGAAEDQLDSLEKATHEALDILVAALDK